MHDLRTPADTARPSRRAFALAGIALALPVAAAARSDAVSADVRDALRLVAGRKDAAAQPFAVIDKKQARLWLFEADGRVRAQGPVLLGAARGDASVPGIGERRLADIALHERTTPAGRFVVEAGINTAGEDVIWVDYDAAVSMHRLRTVRASQRRRQRLASASAADNRISYGCINVAADFFDRQLWPWVRSTPRPVLYVLPETRAVGTVFTGR